MDPIMCGPEEPTAGDLQAVAQFAAHLRGAVCPECAQGKHDNCLGEALDETTDNIVPCGCQCWWTR